MNAPKYFEILSLPACPYIFTLLEAYLQLQKEFFIILQLWNDFTELKDWSLLINSN